MIDRFRQAIVAGVERLTAWADLLDEINVFPVADGDTGRNFVISLAPLRRLDWDEKSAAHDLLLSARGNSGNIASAFFRHFIQSATLEQVPDRIRRGYDHALRVVPDPRPGTILTFFQELVEVVTQAEALLISVEISKILDHLESTVRGTKNQQPELQNAGVVDAGALGMFLFFEGFFQALAGNRLPFRPVMETFANCLRVSSDYRYVSGKGYCVDSVIQVEAESIEAEPMLAPLTDSLIIDHRDRYLKVHLHTQNKDEIRKKLASLGSVVGWAEDDLRHQTAGFGSACP